MDGNQSAEKGGVQMTVDEAIKAALEPFGYDIYNGVSLTREKRHYVFNYSTLPQTFADDAPVFDRCLVQVHLFAPLTENISKWKRQTKKALFDHEFTWPTETDATEADERHIVLECFYLDKVELDDGEI